MTLPSFSFFKRVVSRKRLVFLCAVISVIALAVTFGWTSRQGLFAITGTSTAEQYYSELYFTDTKTIPATLVAGQKYDIPFAIVSQEAAPRTYTYTVHVTEGAETKHLSPVSVDITPGQKAIFTAPFTVRDATAPLMVAVELNTNQTITFRVPQ